MNCDNALGPDPFYGMHNVLDESSVGELGAYDNSRDTLSLPARDDLLDSIS